MERHGISVGIERYGDKILMTFTVVGRLTHEDYEMMTPLIDSALSGVQSPIVDALIDVRALEGWELRAAWDDFKLGLKHGRKFRRCAVVGQQKWMEWAVKVSNWFISGECRVFETVDDALRWLSQTD